MSREIVKSTGKEEEEEERRSLIEDLKRHTQLTVAVPVSILKLQD